MNDESLRQRINEAFDFAPSIDTAHTGVAVDKGIVTRTGHVGSDSEHVAAENAARTVRGMVDAITVTDAEVILVGKPHAWHAPQPRRERRLVCTPSMTT